jgi:penicillin G amidase
MYRRVLKIPLDGVDNSRVAAHGPVVTHPTRPYNLSIMSSTASLPETSPAKARGHNPALRVLYYAVCLLLLAAIAASSWAYWIAHSALPQLDGSVAVPGISSKVRVVRDGRGVPMIEASTLEDLFFAQGYVTAQDRLWQMDIMRRAAAGELSQVIGEATVKLDREERILGLRQAAEASEKLISVRDRIFFDAYARGVNSFIDSHRDRLSLEFRLMKYTPRPWTVIDSLLIGARMVQDLNHYSYARALEREKILAKLGPELTADLYVNASWRDRPPTAMRRMEDDPGAQSGDEDDDDDEEIEPEGGAGRMTSVQELRGVPQGHHSWAGKGPVELGLAPSRAATAFEGVSYTAEADLFRPGSNNWVVSGRHTVSGKPLLSNDMHLNHQMPNLWYEAHLMAGSVTARSPQAGNSTAEGATAGMVKSDVIPGGVEFSFDVAGVTLPGVPFVIVGHNQRIGWGFTNVGPTVEDDFIEEFNQQGQYKTPAGWVEPQRRQETIQVKGKPDVTFDVVTTRHGPIITELIPGETRKIALRWTLQDGEGLVFFDVNSAQNWDEFRKAFSNFYAPGQNVMYGDVDGHIGYQATGRVPIRAAGDGSLPVSGSDDAHEWKGWIPFDEMPRVYDPPSGILATANGRITPDGYKYSISTEWDAPWRTDRIYRVLESGKKFAPADMLALQMDVSSTYDRLCADKFVYAIDHAAGASERAKKAADILRDWDGRMSADSAAPTIETKARRELVRMLLEPKLGAASEGSNHNSNQAAESGVLSWKSYRWMMASVWLDNVLTKQPARWLPPGYSDYGALLTAAVENVVRQTQSTANAQADESVAPADLNQWKWGKNYPVEIDHLVLKQLPLIGRYTGPGSHPLSGSTATVKQVGRGFGPSERATWNFANFDESTLNLVTGESGIFLSPYYMDQWTAWYGGSTFTFPFSQAAVERQRTHELVLEPM